MIRAARFVPLRLSYEERHFLRLLESTLEVSQYTDKVDILPAGLSRSRRMTQQIRHLCSVLTGLVIADDYEAGQALMKDRNFAQNEELFQKIFEIGRRYKILNPERMRDTYGKLIYFLQDTVNPTVNEMLEFTCVKDVETVYKLLQKKRNGLMLLEDPLVFTATREILADGKSRNQVQNEIKEKQSALKKLKSKYATKKETNKKNQSYYRSYFKFFSNDDEDEENNREDNSDLAPGEEHLTEDDIEHAVHSLSDHQTYLRFNELPVEKMIKYLTTYFSPDTPRTHENSLAIQAGTEGARLSHQHPRQYGYVLQSLCLWREVLHEMFTIWHLAERDLLSASCPARLSDTGQGLNRVQNAPNIGAAMGKIVHRVQNRVGGWIGSSVVHLGDHNVPNALMFIDKYTQIPRIIGPIVLCLEKIDDLVAKQRSLKQYIEQEFGTVEDCKKTILRDFFKHAFDGSGADNFFDAGSCIDGRLTSAWNWCSNIEKKNYYHVFLLTGFTGFDGRF